MDKRENLLWQMIITIAFIAIAYVVYSLYYDNDGYLQLLDDFESEEIGTDRQLKEKVQKLEISLKEKQDFITDGSETKYYIGPEDNPSNICIKSVSLLFCVIVLSPPFVKRYSLLAS